MAQRLVLCTVSGVFIVIWYWLLLFLSSQSPVFDGELSYIRTQIRPIWRKIWKMQVSLMLQNVKASQFTFLM